jgi:Tfp pilus assembly protein PilF
MGIDPNFARSYRDRATAYLELGQIDSAIRDCTRAIELDPDYATAYQIRAIAHRARGDLDKMRADVERYRQLGGFVEARPLGAEK